MFPNVHKYLIPNQNVYQLSYSKSIIKEGINGFLIEDGNSDSYVQKLELLIEDEDLRQQMSTNSQESVKKFEIDSIMNEWDKLFKDLIKLSP